MYIILLVYCWGVFDLLDDTEVFVFAFYMHDGRSTTVSTQTEHYMHHKRRLYGKTVLDYTAVPMKSPLSVWQIINPVHSSVVLQVTTDHMQV